MTYLTAASRCNPGSVLLQRQLCNVAPFAHAGGGRIWRGGLRRWRLDLHTLAPEVTSTRMCTTCHLSLEVCPSLQAPMCRGLCVCNPLPSISPCRPIFIDILSPCLAEHGDGRQSVRVPELLGSQCWLVQGAHRCLTRMRPRLPSTEWMARAGSFPCLPSTPPRSQNLTPQVRPTAAVPRPGLHHEYFMTKDAFQGSRMHLEISQALTNVF